MRVGGHDPRGLAELVARLRGPGMRPNGSRAARSQASAAARSGRLRSIAAATWSGVRTAYDEDEVAEVARLTGTSPRRASGGKP
jgi:hypothetical protein